MTLSFEIVAIIPARGGSKHLPEKNLKPLGGKPLVVYAIEQARACRQVGRVVVTTDDDRIAALSRQHGAEVINRPAALAKDEVPVLPVVRHALEYLEKYREAKPLIVIILQPTSPLRTVGDIEAALQLMLDRGAESVLSVSPGERRPGQDYWSPVTEPENGAIFISRRAVIMEQNRLIGKNVMAYPMPVERGIDIDTQEDFDRAEQYLARPEPVERAGVSQETGSFKKRHKAQRK